MIFSELCSRYIQIKRAEDSAFDELRAFGAPSECGSIVADGYRRDVSELLGSNGFPDEDAFLDEVARRTSSRFVHFNFQ
jgi:hypothetical protein